jgi:hypothetical protein
LVKEEKMKLVDFLIEFDTASLEWQSLLAQIPLDRFSSPGPSGGWSLKDVVAHITWHENEMIAMLYESALTGSPWWSLPLNDRNRRIYALNRDLSLEFVLEQSRQVHAELSRLLHQISEEDLNDPLRFKDMPAEDQPWQYFVTNTYEHYRDHFADLTSRIGP